MTTSGEGEAAIPGDALIGTLLAGRYRIEELVGSGGMGAVYRAEHVHMRKAVAVKVLHREMTAVPEVVARFEREAVAGGRIDHPHVVSATDFGQLDDGSFYLALEFVEGRSLSKLIASEGALEPERALRITRQIAQALDAAHGAGVVHRDLKPDNVMLVLKEGDPDYVKVLDFGIAKIKVEEAREQAALTRIGTVFGTPEYMSPEQARGDLVDARADLYTVGVILYEMLAGVSPFKDNDLVVVLTRHLTAEPPPLSASLDPMVVELVKLLLQKSPADRVQTAAELIERLDAILGAPPSIGYAGTPVSGVLSGPRFTATAGSLSGSRGASTDAAQGNAKTLLGDTLNGGLTTRSVSTGFLQRSVDIGHRRVPLWLLAAFALGATLTIAFVIVVGSLIFGGKHAASSSAADPAGESAKPEDSDLARLIERASAGDPTALAELTARPEKKRSLAVWRALGHGYQKLGQDRASLAAYQSGLALHPALAKDPVLLADVRKAVDDAEAGEEALKLAASLGAEGADLLYDAWDSSRAVPNKALVAKRARTWLDDDAVRAKASPALKVLLELNKAQKEGCGGVKRWLARAATEGDTRLVPSLKRFEDRRGCGFLGLGDCYSCLRAGKELSATADIASARPAPVFTGI